MYVNYFFHIEMGNNCYVLLMKWEFKNGD